MTITQYVFVAAFFVFGPSFGALTLRVLKGARPTRGTKPAKFSRAYDFYMIVAVIFSILAAYAGWLFAGLQALQTYPHYPYESPGESTALLYTVPGFITGLFAVGLSYIFGKFFNIFVLIIMSITTILLKLTLCYFGFLGLLFPHQD